MHSIPDIRYILLIPSIDTTEVSATKNGYNDHKKYLNKDVISMIINGSIFHFKNLKVYCVDCILLDNYPNKPKKRLLISVQTI